MPRLQHRVGRMGLHMCTVGVLVLMQLAADSGGVLAYMASTTSTPVYPVASSVSGRAPKLIIHPRQLNGAVALLPGHAVNVPCIRPNLPSTRCSMKMSAAGAKLPQHGRSQSADVPSLPRERAVGLGVTILPSPERQGPYKLVVTAVSPYSFAKQSVVSPKSSCSNN